MSPPASSPTPSLQCSFCAKAFGRVEHLKRHELIHSRARRFNCASCGKEFTRKDALQRHQATHQEVPSLLSKGVRACIPCAAAKIRCSGDSTCARCQRRGLICSYPSNNGSTDLTVAPAPALGSSLPETASRSESQHVGPFQGSSDQMSATVFSTMDHSVPFSYNTMSLDVEFWNPSILSTTNWLDSIVDADLSGFPADLDVYQTPASEYPTGLTSYPHGWNTGPTWIQGEARAQVPVHRPAGSPVALASTVSGLSAVSTESAAEICAAQEQATSEAGEYYVDGEPARLPRTKRRKLGSKSSATPATAAHIKPNFSLQSPVLSSADLKHRIGIPSDTYETLMNVWRNVCLDSTFPWPVFDHAEFPQKEFFEYLLGLYFASFHRTLPFLHPPSFNATKTHWLLLMAMTAIGARSIDGDGAQTFATSLQELLRRCLLHLQENGTLSLVEPLVLLQVRMLHIVGMTYCGDDRHVRQGLEMQHFLSSARHIASAYCNVPEARPKTGMDEEEREWEAWVRREGADRTAHCAWMMDCMFAYHFQGRPWLALHDATPPLPCVESLWDAASAKEWKRLSAQEAATPELQEALQQLYIDKSIPTDRGEFARIIVIHGLFHRMWEVEHFFSNPMSQWEPTAKKQSSSKVLPKLPVSLYAIPAFTKWQNSVCDCLDILHWQANATIGQASGLEHPTVAFLHLARIVLLTPINSIVDLAKATVGLSEGPNVDVNAAKRTIGRWASQGQYKARLAAIHAGVVFWHIRRYSVDGFYEAPAVALAALMLWAFGTFSAKQNVPNQNALSRSTQPVRPQADTHSASSSGSDDSACEIILLDRPTDDELVQQFVRRGHTMRAHMTGVGDLYAPQGPRRVLLEGSKLLGVLKCWGVSLTWQDLLQRLAAPSEPDVDQR